MALNLEKPTETQKSKKIPGTIPNIEVVNPGDIPPWQNLRDVDMRMKIWKVLEASGKSNGPMDISWSKGVIYVTFRDINKTILLRWENEVNIPPDYIWTGKDLQFTPSAITRITKFLQQNKIHSAIASLWEDLSYQTA